MQRDFTYIDDIVTGVVNCLDSTPDVVEGEVPQRLYNIGNNKPEQLMRLIEILEQAIGKKAVIDFQPMQPGDVTATYADIDAMSQDFGFSPATPIDVGLPKFVEWYRGFYG